MTWEHIPLDDAKTKKARMNALDIDDDEDPLLVDFDVTDTSHNKYVRVNFPPFWHYIINSQGQPECVGKSHWIGGLDSGSFSKDHGAMTKKLAMMFMKMCDRYATKYNWRNYTYNDEMRGQALLQLSHVGLKFNESKSNNPFAYYTATIGHSFTRVLNTEKEHQVLRDNILEQNNFAPSYTRQNAGSWGGEE